MAGALRYDAIGPKNLEIWLRCLVADAAEKVQGLSDQFTPGTKVGFGGHSEVVTSADLASHQLLLNELAGVLDGFGCVSEEKKLRLACSFEDADAYITFDELDGSEAYARGFLFGVAVMLALVVNGKVVAAYIADVRSRTMVGYGPDSTGVMLWRDFDFGEASLRLAEIERPAELQDLPVLLRDELVTYEPGIAAVARSVECGGAFKRYVVSDSGVSIGFSVLQLLLGQVGALVMRGKKRWSPWDDTPWIGMCKKLGFVCVRVSPDGTQLIEIDPPLVQEETPRNYEIILVHHSHVGQLQTVFAKAAARS